MRFKVKKNDQFKHQDICTSVAWTVNNDVYSISDDQVILKWDANTQQAQKFMELDNFPTSFDWLPLTKGVNDSFAIGFVDGSFRLITKLGKVEKVVTDAHKNGALIALKWSYDGGSLVTAGEDGSIKVWSKTGNPRTTIIQLDKSVYSVKWSPDNESILYCTDRNIYIKPIQPGHKQIQWKAHEGVVLNIDWNPTNNLIVSCGEDCRYKVWDTYGRILYSSQPYDYVISSVAWSPNGEYFAVGAFGMFKLCDKTGWTYSFDKTDVGSLMNLGWSSDGTICVGAGGSGNLVFGYLVDRSLCYENWEINLNEDNKIVVSDMLNEQQEELDFKDRVINMSMSYNHIIITTSSQCYIQEFQQLNTPQIIDVKDAVSLIIQSNRYFCLVEVTQGIMVYNYEGKLISNPKIPGIKFEFINLQRISISQDILAIIDGANPKVIKFFDIVTGKQMNFTLDHNLEVIEIHLNQVEQAGERKIAFMDINRDLYLSPVHKRDTTKLSAMTDSFLWNDRTDILASIADGRLLTWYYPNAIYVDKDLMDQCKIIKEAAEIGRMSNMLTFCGSQVTLRRKDGGLITLSVSPYPQILFDFCEKAKWEKAIKLCRFVKEQTLWACLAAISLHARELNTAEIALAAIEAVDKVQYINYVKELPNEVVRQAALMLYFHKTQEAEQIFIQNKLQYRAIKLNIKLYRWDRALELALQFKAHLDTVVGYRKRYLQKIGKEETNKKFIKHNAEVEVKWEEIKQRIKQEKEKEAKGK